MDQFTLGRLRQIIANTDDWTPRVSDDTLLWVLKGDGTHEPLTNLYQVRVTEADGSEAVGLMFK